MQKICSRCGESKSLSEFSFRKKLNKFRTSCKPCEAICAKEYRDRNPQKVKDYRIRYKKEVNPDYHKTISPERKRLKNIKEVDRRRRNKEEYNKKRAASRDTKKEYLTYTVERRKRIRECSLRGAFKEEMDKLKSSKKKGECLDHIIPLFNEKVSGLHVYWNIQILTIGENSTKGKLFDGTNENNSWRNLLH